MYSDEFEIAFSNFLDCREYDDAQEYIFSIARAAFSAGWIAAGGEMPSQSKDLS